MTPAQAHYFRLLDATTAKWSGTIGAIKVAASASGHRVKHASPVVRSALKALKRGKLPTTEAMNAIRQGVKDGQIPLEGLPEVLQAQLKAQAAKSPTKGLLAAGAAGGLGGYLAGRGSGKSDSRQNAAAGFGAGIATGLAAPTILSGLNEIVANQGLMPGSYSPSDAGYFMQI